MSPRRKAVALLVFTALLWSLGGVLIKEIQWAAPAIAGARSAIAACLMLTLARRDRFTFSGPQIGAAVCYALTVTLFVLANKLTTAANAILLQYTAPFWVALFAPWYLKERSHRSDWAILALILGGIVLFFCDQLTPAGLWGNLLALAAGAAFGWLTLFLRKQKSHSGMESVLLGNLLAALACAPYFFGAPPAARGSHVLGIVLLLALGLFQLGLSYICYTAAVRHVSALEASLIPSLEPILNPLLVLVIVGERPGAYAILGGALVLGAVTAEGILTARRTAG